MKRVQEPVHLKMALYADRLTDPEKEIRVVEYDPLLNLWGDLIGDETLRQRQHDGHGGGGVLEQRAAGPQQRQEKELLLELIPYIQRIEVDLST